MNKWKISFFISLFVLIISNFYWVIEMGGAIAGSHDMMVLRDEIHSKDRSFAVLEDLLTNGNLFKDYNSFVSVASEKYKDHYFVEVPSKDGKNIQIEDLKLMFKNDALIEIKL